MIARNRWKTGALVNRLFCFSHHFHCRSPNIWSMVNRCEISLVFILRSNDSSVVGAITFVPLLVKRADHARGPWFTPLKIPTHTIFLLSARFCCFTTPIFTNSALILSTQQIFANLGGDISSFSPCSAVGSDVVGWSSCNGLRKFSKSWLRPSL